MLLLIDNYDSFTYNLYQYFCELGQEVKVIRNDKTTLPEIEKMAPERIVISPGPSTPLQAGISNEVIRHFGPHLPILGVFKGLPDPLSVIRYHSLVVKKEGLPECLEITAWTDDGTIMGIKHREHPVEGVQFHPESFMTQNGKDLLKNFLNGSK